MATADLSRKATLESMVRLGDTGGGVAEGIGDEGNSKAESFDGRNGYDRAFLNGWEIPLPLATGPAKDDMRKLRRGGSGVELKYRNFSVVMSKPRRLPMITAANIDGSEARALERENDKWNFDGRLDKEDQFGEELYFENPLDRGHMVRRLDPVWGSLDVATQANDDTFHFTNACPQMKAVNQVTWVSLENFILNHAKADGMRVNVFTGPFFSEQDLVHARSGALIPLSFWKVVAIVTEDGRPSATAYKVSQQEELKDLEFVFAGFKTYQISVQQVIVQTHVDFSPLVDFDGFSQFELASGQRLVEPLESLEQVRV